MKTVVYKWRNITVDMVRELYVARENLSNSGARTDLVTNVTRSTFSQYCDEIGIARMTAHRWLKRYDEENDIILDEIEYKEKQPVYFTV